MPRTAKSRAKSSKRSKEGAAGKKNAAKPKTSFTVADVLEKAQSSIDVYDYDMAQRYCQKALEMDNDNIQVLELTGRVMMEVGNLEAAKQCYGRCVQLEPDSGHLKYLHLGQLMDGVDAVNAYRKAIELMLNQIETQENNPSGAAGESQQSTAPTCKDVSSAHLAIAELYMTDLCDESDAEEVCVTNIKKAIEHDQTNPEGYQVLADYHLVKEEMKEAKEHILKSISLWLPSAKSLAVDDEGAAVDDPTDCVPISSDAQLKTAKTLIEVEEYNHATDVLELLLDQDDTIVDTWYLIGWANYLQGDDYKPTAKYYLERCSEVAEKADYEDTDVISHVNELLEELKSIRENDGEGDDFEESINEEEMEED